MMRFELGLEESDPKRALKSALTIAVSYVVWGIIPLLAYTTPGDVGKVLPVSSIVTLATLFGFGFVKGHFTTVPRLTSALRTVFVGGLAAAIAYWLAGQIS